MKALTSRIVKSIPFGARLEVCDNSGAKRIRLFGVKGHKTRKGQYPAAGVSDLIFASIIKGRPGMKKETVSLNTKLLIKSHQLSFISNFILYTPFLPQLQLYL